MDAFRWLDNTWKNVVKIMLGQRRVRLSTGPRETLFLADLSYMVHEPLVPFVRYHSIFRVSSEIGKGLKYIRIFRVHDEVEMKAHQLFNAYHWIKPISWSSFPPSQRSAAATGEAVLRILGGLLIAFCIPFIFEVGGAKAVFGLVSMFFLLFLIPFVFWGQETAGMSVEEASNIREKQ